MRIHDSQAVQLAMHGLSLPLGSLQDQPLGVPVDIPMLSVGTGFELPQWFPSFNASHASDAL
jgi:hypothetical protein